MISYQRDGLIILCQHPPLSQQCCLSQPPPLLSRCLPHVHVGMGRGGKKAVGDICQLSSLIEELMKFTTWLLAGEPIPALTKGGPCLVFCLWNRDDFNFSVKLQLICFQASVGLFLSSKLSSSQLMPKTQYFQTRRLTSTRPSSVARGLPESLALSSPFSLIIFTVVEYSYATRSHLSWIFFLSSQQRPSGMLVFHGDTRNLMR